MKIILLKNIKKLGKLGEIINTKPGYSNNFLLPQGKAISATKENIKYFFILKFKTYKNIIDIKNIVNSRIKKIKEIKKINIKVKSEHENKIFGSIGIKNIITILKKFEININKKEIFLPNGVLKNLGLHIIKIKINKKLNINIKINIIK